MEAFEISSLWYRFSKRGEKAAYTYRHAQTHRHSYEHELPNPLLLGVFAEIVSNKSEIFHRDAVHWVFQSIHLINIRIQRLIRSDFSNNFWMFFDNSEELFGNILGIFGFVWKMFGFCLEMFGICWEVLGVFWECFGTLLEHYWKFLEMF